MCKSQADGGQRCAAHTRSKYETLTRTDPGWDAAAAEYASTPEGHDRLTEEADQAAAAGDFETEAHLRSAITRGEAMRAANKETAQIIKNDLTTWEPVAIDTELADLYGKAAALRQRRDSEHDFLAREVSRRYFNRPGFTSRRATAEELDEAITAITATPDAERAFHHRELLKYHERITKLDTEIAALHEQMSPLNDEFQRRGGWTRAFLVTNGNGHVHSSMNCSTCHPTTRYHWVTEYSDHNETEIVEAAGERACTVCYPSAPTDVRNRPTRIFSPEEREQQRSREQRAAAAQQRNADKIAKALTSDGSEFEVDCTRNGHREREWFKTERAATSWMVSNMADYRGWLSHREMDASMAEAHESIIEALAAKHGKTTEEIRVDIEKKVAAKVRRDAR